MVVLFQWGRQALTVTQVNVKMSTMEGDTDGRYMALRGIVKAHLNHLGKSIKAPMKIGLATEFLWPSATWKCKVFSSK